MLTATVSPHTIDMTSARRKDTGYSSRKPGMMRGKHMSSRDEVTGVAHVWRGHRTVFVRFRP